jgi:heme/copper-type cytochrome/quinol oxidase subunit 1
MTIEWNKVTWYSKLAAVILGVGIFVLGIYLGMTIEKARDELKNTQPRVTNNGDTSSPLPPITNSNGCEQLPEAACFEREECMASYGPSFCSYDEELQVDICTDDIVFKGCAISTINR